MLHAEFGDDDWAMEECSTEDMEPEAMYSAPFDPNTLYVHYDAAALQECLSAWGADEPQRKATATALSNLIAKVESTAGTSDDSELEKLRGWRKALNRLETRHRIAAELKASLGPPALDGPLKGALVAKEEYVYTAEGDARRYAKGERWKDGDGKWRSATSQGMPSDLRTKTLG